MRVVLDTNILVSFAIRPTANFRRIFEYVIRDGDVLICEETLAELSEVLTRDKFMRYFSRVDDIRDYIEWYEAMGEMIDLVEHVVACRDPKDDKFLALAVSGRADCIIAGDADLTTMGTFRGIPIYSPATFLRAFGLEPPARQS
jgi:uncharacterized protein